MQALQQVVAADQYGALPPTTSAYRLGQYAAQLGEECLPQNTFVFRHEQHEYLRGFRDYVAKANKSQVTQ